MNDEWCKCHQQNTGQESSNVERYILMHVSSVSQPPNLAAVVVERTLTKELEMSPSHL